MFYGNRRRIAWLLSVVGIWVVGTTQVQAETRSESETVLEKIARTGELTAGTRTDAAPFAYTDQNGRWVGYSIDLLEQIRANLEQQLRQPIQLNLVAVNPSNRISMLTDHEVDIVCGATSFTPGRDLDVDFSISYFVTGTQLLINPNNGLGADFTIGVLANTTNQQLVERIFPIAQFATFSSRADAFLALQRNRIDALASDGILLEALRRSAPDAPNYEVVPSTPYDQETYACMLPQNQEPFRQVVNTSLLEFMQGVLAGDAGDLSIFNTWFGPQGVVPIDQQLLLAFFRSQVQTQAEASTADPDHSSQNR